jgi:hypothetical protein
VSIDILNRHKAIISKALGTEDGRELVKLLRESFVDVNLMGKDDRETVSRVAKHDLVIYLIEMGELNNV